MATKRVKATFDYLATEPGELSIKKGDIINVLEEDATGWWKGELRGLVGFFPSNFSEVIPSSPADAAAQSNIRRMSMAPKPARDNASTVAEEHVRAKHNYKGSAADGELSFSKGDVLKVLNKDESGWWKGELNGRTGFFPHNFVVAIQPGAVVKQQPQQQKQPQQKAAVKQAAAAAAPAAAAAATTAPAGGGGGGGASKEALAAAERKLAEAQKEAQAAQQRAAEAEKRAAEAEGRLQEAQESARQEVEAARQEGEQTKVQVQRLQGETVADADINELRDIKHELKAALERVQKALNERKACPACEKAVKDCIVVPCLHAFCHKCGERNKKQVKCSICGVPPERIYLLGNKK